MIDDRDVDPDLMMARLTQGLARLADQRTADRSSPASESDPSPPPSESVNARDGE